MTYEPLNHGPWPLEHEAWVLVTVDTPHGGYTSFYFPWDVCIGGYKKKFDLFWPAYKIRYAW